MITPDVFDRNEALRQCLIGALEVVEIAFLAADTAEAEDMQDVKGDALFFSMKHAERNAITRYKNRIRKLAQIPREQVSPLEASYTGVDEFDKIRIDAEREHAESLPKPTPTPTTRKSRQ